MCLITGFKNSVSSGSEDFPIRTDFRVWLLVDRILKSDALAEEKIARVLGLVYTKLPQSFGESLSLAIDFYAGGKKKESGGERLFDFEYDSKLILAAFRQQYNINLLTENLHWHEFLALFSALGEETLFIKVIKVRGMDLSKIKDSDRRRELSKLKKAYALPYTKQEERENEELILSLKKDGGGEK